MDSPAPDAAAAVTLQNAALRWSNGACHATGLVDAACDALVAGLDTPALRELAAVNHRDADYDVPLLLPTVLEELGLTLHPPGSLAAQEAWARLLAADTLAGLITPRELAREIHSQFSHRLPLAEPLATLDVEYDILEYAGHTTAEALDAEVLAEARRLVSSVAQKPDPPTASFRCGAGVRSRGPRPRRGGGRRGRRGP